MSRTIRAKSYERVNPNSSFVSEKIAGYYTEYDFVDGVRVFRPPTHDEWWRAWKINHCDRKAGSRGPHKGLKKSVNTKEDTKYKRQFNRWLRNPEYEIIDQFIPTSARWEWD